MIAASSRANSWNPCQEEKSSLGSSSQISPTFADA